MFVNDPRGITASLWAAQTGLQLAPYGTIPELKDERLWQQWAAYVVGLPAIAAANPPQPHGFADWRRWAAQFNLAIGTL